MNGSLPDYFSLPLTRFLDETAQAQSVPGGGSVAAMSAVLGCSLARMVGAYTLANKKLAHVHQEVAALQQKLADSGRLFRELVAEDMAAYRAYAQARKLSGDSDAEAKQRRQATMAALAVPVEILALCSNTLKHCDSLKDRAAKSLLSDLLAAAHLLRGAAHAAAANARLNLKELDDPELADAHRTQIAAALDHADQHLVSISSAITSALHLPV